MERKTNLVENITLFCRFLRNEGFQIGSSQEMDALGALAYISWEKPENFRESLKITLVKNYWQHNQFDTLFYKFWSELKRANDSKVKNVPEKESKNKAKRPPPIEVIKNWLHGNPIDKRETSIYDPGKVKGRRDFSIFSEEDLKDWQEVIRIVRKKISDIPGRRQMSTQKSGKLFLRSTIRTNLRRGGELIELNYLQKKPKKANVIILADVSRSMELYSRELLRMMYSFQNSNINLETFVFSSSIYRITKKLKAGNFRQALKSISEFVDEWSGGTRLGDCLNTFHKKYGKLLGSGKTYVFIVSDGLDNGDIELFEKGMKSIKKKSRKIFWFNPLAKSAEYTIQTKAMQVAGQYIDYLVPATGVSDFKRFLGNTKW